MATKKHARTLSYVYSFFLLFAVFSITLFYMNRQLAVDSNCSQVGDDQHLQQQGLMLHHDPTAPEGKFMNPLNQKSSKKRGIAQGRISNWAIPEEQKNHTYPDFCGPRVDFAPFAKSSATGRLLNRAVGSKTMFQLSRPDLIERVRHAVQEIDKSGAMDENSYCRVFDSCKEKKEDLMRSRHSIVYQVCHTYDWLHASNILTGVSTNKLPGELKLQGDKNVLCEIAHYVSDLVTKVIFPSVGMHGMKCVVQEQFINEQRSGEHTRKHVHPDDSYGGVFYLDVPKNTRLCIENSETEKRKESWKKYAPNLTENLFPEAPYNMGATYPAYIEPAAGDFVFFPVGWMKHWVPELSFPENEKRSSLVFNLVCL